MVYRQNASMSTLPPPLQQVNRTYVLYRQRKVSYFGGCDYFRLASHPAVLRAFQTGLKKFGGNVAASRMTTGNHFLYEELETKLAHLFGVESALLASNGYLTNLAVAQSLAGTFSHALIDERAHASLHDATDFLNCPAVPFRHRDPMDVARIVQRLGHGIRLVLLTDGMFAHDGSVAPLQSYRQVLPRDATLWVDDAHGAGVLGRTGQGSLEYESLPHSRTIVTITLSKAFGAYGGAILGARQLRQQIVSRSRLFTGNTPLPLPMAAAALEALTLLRTEKNLRTRLGRNTRRAKDALRETRLPSVETPGPILAWVPPTRSAAEALKRRLLAAAIYPSFIQYPGGPPYFRFALSSEHSPSQVERLVDTLLTAPV
jgi:7-keto-8-aminopelargonate synthetase-like enzyme